MRELSIQDLKDYGMMTYLISSASYEPDRVFKTIIKGNEQVVICYEKTLTTFGQVSEDIYILAPNDNIVLRGGNEDFNQLSKLFVNNPCAAKEALFKIWDNRTTYIYECSELVESIDNFTLKILTSKRK